MDRPVPRPCSVASPRLSVRDLPGKGRAVFAAAPFAAGELIAVWGGIIIPLAQAFDLSAAEFTQCIQVEDDFVLWTADHLQTEADWINHSCDPNAGIAGQISVVAMRDIAAGEEICFDYAMSSASAMDTFHCLCGAPGCRGFVRADDWRRPDLQQRYRGYFSDFLARRIAREQALPAGYPAAPARFEGATASL